MQSKNNKDIIDWLPHRLLKLSDAFLNKHPEIALHELDITLGIQKGVKSSS